MRTVRKVQIVAVWLLTVSILASGAMWVFNGRGTITLTVDQAESVALSDTEYATLGIAALNKKALQAIGTLKIVAGRDGQAQRAAQIALDNIQQYLRK